MELTLHVTWVGGRAPLGSHRSVQAETPASPAMWHVFRADAVAWTAVGGWAVEGVRKASSLP